MQLDFEQETPEGFIKFTGNLTKDEVDFLLRFAILSLMARGTLPLAMAMDNNPEIEPETIN